MVLEHLEDCGRFCSFLGALRVTPAKWLRRALKVVQSFSKFTCHHFIALWGCPHLKKIEEEWPLSKIHLVYLYNLYCFLEWKTFYADLGHNVNNTLKILMIEVYYKMFSNDIYNDIYSFIVQLYIAFWNGNFIH